MRFFFIGILLSSNLLASEWANLSEGNLYKLNQNFQLRQIGIRSGSLLDFSKSESYTLKKIVPLDAPLPATVFIFKHNNCPGLQNKAAFEHVKIEASGVVVGVTFGKCELNVFIEPQDYNSISFFE
jgi:hypothetical protein